jgi:hypothetical protein
VTGLCELWDAAVFVRGTLNAFEFCVLKGQCGSSGKEYAVEVGVMRGVWFGMYAKCCHKDTMSYVFQYTFKN